MDHELSERSYMRSGHITPNIPDNKRHRAHSQTQTATPKGVSKTSATKVRRDNDKGVTLSSHKYQDGDATHKLSCRGILLQG